MLFSVAYKQKYTASQSESGVFQYKRNKMQQDATKGFKYLPGYKEALNFSAFLFLVPEKSPKMDGRTKKRLWRKPIRLLRLCDWNFNHNCIFQSQKAKVASVLALTTSELLLQPGR